MDIAVIDQSALLVSVAVSPAGEMEHSASKRRGLPLANYQGVADFVGAGLLGLVGVARSAVESGPDIGECLPRRVLLTLT